MKGILSGLVITLLLIMLVWGMWWGVKNGSYHFWYKDMVKGTITEMVKSEALKE